MGALTAENVVAALVFLDGLGTVHVGAHLGVRKDPVEVCFLVGGVQLPLLEHLAVSWSVLLLATFETKLVAAFAIHDFFQVRNSLRCKFALLGEWTPSHIFVVVCERLTVPSHISFEDW